MKKYIKSFLIAAISITFLSCSTDAPDLEVSLTVDNPNPQIGETVTFTVTGGADTYVIYTGDPSHEYSKSYLAVTSDQNPDQELVVLVSDSLPPTRNYLEPIIDNYNSSAGPNDQYNLDNIMTSLSNLVGKEYTNKLSAAYEIYLLMPEITNQVPTAVVDMFFEDRSVLLAPEGGFSTGVAINRYETTYTYAYSEAGTFTATLIATNVSDKQYSGSGYIDDRSSSADEYDFNLAIKEVVISVQP